MSTRHFITLLDFERRELERLLSRASELRRRHAGGGRAGDARFAGRTLAMIFEKASTRTRVSFEAGMTQLGGSAMFLSPRDTQLGRGEPVADTARVLSRMVDCVMIRANAHSSVKEFAAHSRVPVINGLTDRFHPCQLLADLQTWREHRGAITGTVAWIGDGNNVCNSYIHAARRMGFRLRVASPRGYEPDTTLIGDARVDLVADPESAARDADVVVTDVWASMGQEAEQQERAAAFARYQVTPRLMGLAKPDALFMHCLPAHRGEEVSAGVIDGPRSVVWDEAENRLHAQKALLEFLLAEDR